MTLLPNRKRNILATFVVMSGALAALPAVASAGGGPEGLFLVVNSRSWASLSIANHFIALRGIPDSNVLHLDWAGDNDRVDLATFREALLRPTLAAIEERGLDNQIDCVAWSSDFPWSIEVSGERTQKLPPQYGTHASLTALTFFADMALVGDPNFVGDRANYYYSRPPDDDLHKAPASRAFSRSHGWNDDGSRNEAGGKAFLLSTMLAITSGDAISTAEAVELLTRSAAADGARPAGTFYFVKNTDVRSTTRDPYFAAAAAALEELGKRAEVVDGVVPMGKTDVLGAMLGAAAFHWKTSRSEMLPGAICEHLTSFGGMFSEGHGQTTLAELLRHGAAGSSGTIEEPYAIQAKFPTAWIHVHYARGCSLAESFYQSVEWPFQLLVAGDPLCQPHAFPPQVALAKPPPASPWTGTIELEPECQATGERPAERWEWYVDGIRHGAAATGDKLAIDTTRLADGHHELRIVGVESGPIGSRTGLIIPFYVNNAGRDARLERVAPDRPVRWGELVEFRVVAPGAASVELLHGRRVVAQFEMVDGSGVTSFDPQQFGSGPVTLTARARAAGGSATWNASPIRFQVLPEEFLPAKEGRNDDLAPGLRLLRADGSQAIVGRTIGDWLREAGVQGEDAFTLQAEFDVPEDDVYQFQCRHRGSLVIRVDDRTAYFQEDGRSDLCYAPIALAAGRHALVVEGAGAGDSQVVLRFGSRGVRPLHSDLFVYPE